jgi:hypothetical protein
MPTILKIGYQEFVVKRASDAAAVVKALADAVHVGCTYRDGQHYYWPETGGRMSEIGMHTVQPGQLLAKKPEEDEALDAGGDIAAGPGYAGAHNANGLKPLKRINGKRQLLLPE